MDDLQGYPSINLQYLENHIPLEEDDEVEAAIKSDKLWNKAWSLVATKNPMIYNPENLNDPAVALARGIEFYSDYPEGETKTNG
jgi:hypothetical protein